MYLLQSSLRDTQHQSVTKELRHVEMEEALKDEIRALEGKLKLYRYNDERFCTLNAVVFIVGNNNRIVEVSTIFYDFRCYCFAVLSPYITAVPIFCLIIREQSSVNCHPRSS